MNTCAFCKQQVFNDDRAVGSVRNAEKTLTHYHINCLAERYPQDAKNMRLNERAIKLFGDSNNQVEYGEA